MESRDYDFREERGLEEDYSIIEKIFNSPIKFLISTVSVSVFITSAFCYYIDKINKNDELLINNTLKIADTNKNGILEQSELADLIREIEPGYVMPKLDNFLLDITWDGKIIIGKGDKYLTTTTIYLPKNKLEEYLTKHK